MPYWGVDSSWYPVYANVRVPDRLRRPDESGHVEEPLFDYVTRRAGRAPEFWGRYLNDNHPQSRLRPDEPQYLFDRDCRLALVFNGIRTQPPAAERSRQAGVSAAERAILQANQYNIQFPSRVRIYLDLEGWTVTPDFLEGWWAVMHASQYAGAGGLYGRGAETRLRHRSRSHLRDHSHRPYSRGWSRQVITAEDRIEEQQMDSLLDDLASGRSSDAYSIYIWSNTPRRYDRTRDTPSNAEIIPSTFGAVGPVGSMLTRTVIWQYRFGAFWERGADGGTVDLDLALDAAYQNMWSG